MPPDTKTSMEPAKCQQCLDWDGVSAVTGAAQVACKT